jgi:hypothetical protein
VEESGAQLADALASASEFLRTAARIGVIVQKAETRPKHDGGEEQFCTFQVVNILSFIHKFYLWVLQDAVLRIRDAYPVSRISDSGSRIQKQQQKRGVKIWANLQRITL